MADPRLGLTGYIADAAHGGFDIGRAERLARDGVMQSAAILVAEAREPQRPTVIANKQLVDTWRGRLAPFGFRVGVWVVHGTDPLLDAQHYAAWKHVDFFCCNAEDVYVNDPTRSQTFLQALGQSPPLVLSTNGNPAQRAMNYRVWEQRGAILATQAYWQFNVVSYLTPKVAYQQAYLPQQVNIGPSTTSWWYRIWRRNVGNRWAQSVGEIQAQGKRYIALKVGATMYHSEITLHADGGRYLTNRVLLANGTTDVGRVLGFFPKTRITPHVSNENGDQGRPTLADLHAKIAESPSRKYGVGVFTLDNSTDDELRTIKAAMST